MIWTCLFLQSRIFNMFHSVPVRSAYPTYYKWNHHKLYRELLLESPEMLLQSQIAPCPLFLILVCVPYLIFIVYEEWCHILEEMMELQSMADLRRKLVFKFRNLMQDIERPWAYHVASIYCFFHCKVHIYWLTISFIYPV